MLVNIIRGQNQIGGSIIEVSTKNTSITFDIGIEFDEGVDITVPQIEGLFCGTKKFDAVFISHYHSDHIGLINNLIDEIPIYMGEIAFNVLQASNAYRNIETPFKPNFIMHNTPIVIGDIKVTPISCDHSAFDSYMYLIEADGKKVLYTGDFRENGRFALETTYNSLSKVDALLIEGTTLSREEAITNIQEEKLEDIAAKALKNNSYPAFIMMSAMNIDRLVTAYNIAKKTERIFLEDIYTAQIAKAAGNISPNPNSENVKVFMTGGDKQHALLQQFENSKIGKLGISKTNFLMCIRPSMKNYLSKLNEICSFRNGILFYGMWKGYLERPDMKDFIEFMKSLGVKIHILHTSGHADAPTIDKIVSLTQPKEIIPVHTENADWFSIYKDVKIIYNCDKYEIK